VVQAGTASPTAAAAAAGCGAHSVASCCCVRCAHRENPLRCRHMRHELRFTEVALFSTTPSSSVRYRSAYHLVLLNL
jgi:hypothetical protein